MIVFLNGKIISDKKATVSIYDHGFLYGDGVYETIRVYGGRPFMLDEHLRRLNNSMKGIRLVPPVSLMEIGRAVVKTVRANRHKEAVVRITVTRGPGPYGFDPRPLKNPTLAITSQPFTPYPKTFTTRGITAAIVSVRRNSPLSLPPTVKSTSCLNNILAKMEANDLGADEAIFLSQENYVAEGTVSNVFMVRGKTVMTPRLEGFLLSGVTRNLTCRLAREAGFHVEEKRLSPADLAAADEIFLTNTTMEVMPVTRLIVHIHSDRRIFALGPASPKPGPITRRLMALFKASTKK
jgi:branched-chain amino acid aminotransferase